MKKWIVADVEHFGGIPRVRDTCIFIALILESLAAGMCYSQKPEDKFNKNLVDAFRKCDFAHFSHGSD